MTIHKALTTRSFIIFFVIILVLLICVYFGLFFYTTTQENKGSDYKIKGKLQNQVTTPVCEGREENLTLLLPLPASSSGFNECTRVLFPSLSLFWPYQYQKLKLIVLLDEEAKNVSNFGKSINEEFYKQFDMENSEIEIKLNSPPSLFNDFNFTGYPNRIGWHRQQWIMFWADNFTTSEYVGFIDSDAIFTTRILPRDLFDNGKPVVRALFGKAHKGYTADWTESSTLAIGRPEPFNCMSYFPVIFKAEHLKKVRQRIIDQLGPNLNFESAYKRLLEYKQGSYSQYNIMCSYLFHFQRDDYRWTLYEKVRKDWQGPFLPSQTGKSDEIRPFLNKTQWRPAISAHWSYETYNHDFNKIVATGACFSWPEVKNLCDKKPDIDYKSEKINMYEWVFEAYIWALADFKQATKSHRKRQFELSICKQRWNPYLTNRVNFLFQQNITKY